MNRHRYIGILSVFLVTMVALVLSAGAPEAAAKKNTIPLAIAKIFFEYNSSASVFGDLGVHIFLDGEDWKEIKIVNPEGRTIFEVEGKGPYRELGMTELFFEGAEPDLADVPLNELLEKFPNGEYKFIGKTVDGERIEGTATLSHAIPDGPFNVLAVLNGNSLVISWDAPTGSLTSLPIDIVAYQVIVGTFQVTVPADVLCTVVTVPPSLSMCVTVTPEFVQSLAGGQQPFEVLAIEAGGNQTITEGSFIKQ
jgi:hypothetical protein